MASNQAIAIRREEAMNRVTHHVRVLRSRFDTDAADAPSLPKQDVLRETVILEWIGDVLAGVTNATASVNEQPETDDAPEETAADAPETPSGDDAAKSDDNPFGFTKVERVADKQPDARAAVVETVKAKAKRS